MDSELQHQQYQHHFESPQRQIQHQSSLTRFNSAPSSCFSSFLDEKSDEKNRYEFASARPLSPETERILANFVSSMSDENKEESYTEKLGDNNKVVYQSQLKPPLAKQSSLSVLRGGVGSSSSGGGGSGGGCGGGGGGGGGGSSGLTRHGSSPAGFFNNMLDNDGGLLKQSSDNIKTEPYTCENQSGGGMSHNPGQLCHHLSLPKQSLEISEMEKILELHDIVPCKLRAKRGFATHPRSIAERNRRIKISDRMRKLQALVPNMNEQTNTAEMLDLAVDYIRDLQNQIKELTDSRDKCTCCNSYTNFKA